MVAVNKKDNNIKKSAIKSSDDGILISKAVRTILANRRQAPAKTLKRGEVRGGGRKPWRQKGTGRARAGSSRSPIWRSGGVTFGPTGNENYSLSMNKKEMKIAKEQVLASKKPDILNLSIEKITKTKEASNFLSANKIEGRVLILIDAKDELYERTKRSFRNIKNVKVKMLGNEDIYDLMNAQKILNLSLLASKAKKENK